MLSVCTGGLIATLLATGVIARLAPATNTRNEMKEVQFMATSRGVVAGGWTSPTAVLEFPSRLAMGDQAVVSLRLSGWVSGQRATLIKGWEQRTSQPFAVAAANSLAVMAEGVTGSLRAPDFAKEPSGEGMIEQMSLLEPVEWSWVVVPKSTGSKHVVITVATQSGESPEFDRWTVGQAGAGAVRLGTKSIEFTTDVVNEWGMSRKQEQGVGGLAWAAGLLSTILAYPIWSALFKKRAAV